ATGLIAGALVINKQFHFIQDRDLGIRIDQTLLVPLRHPALRAQFQVIRNEFLSLEGVQAVTASSSNPANTNIITSLYSQGQSVLGIRALAVDYDFVKAMGIHLVSGRNFSRGVPTDSAGAIIVNEAAARKLQAFNLLDRPLELAGVGEERKSNMVIGVMRDFHYRPLYYAIEPMVLYLAPAGLRFMEVKMAPGATSRTIAELKRAWEGVVPEYPFDFTFLDEGLKQVYTADQRTRALFDLFSLLAIGIGSLGLFGIASHAAEKRAKEIGIRKVLGSSVGGIVVLLSRELVLMVGAAGLLASAAAYFFLRSWLETFSYRIDLTPWIFLQAIVLVSLTALLTVGVRAARAALANPVDSLRYE
ncbi:MAG TPA: FtsX-like permease family protein, partial [Bacteroidota bacterium]